MTDIQNGDASEVIEQRQNATERGGAPGSELGPNPRPSLT
jgi:hypothetical protein